MSEKPVSDWSGSARKWVGAKPAHMRFHTLFKTNAPPMKSTL